MPTPKARTNAGVRSALSLVMILAVVAAALADITAALALRNGLDPSFVTQVGDVADWRVEEVAVQPDGKILVGGVFTNVNGATRRGLVRLNADGSTDAGFSPPPFNWITDFDLLPSGKIYVAVADGLPVFGPSSPEVFRLNADGSVDTSFTAPLFAQDQELGAAGIEALPDGRLYLSVPLDSPPPGIPSRALKRLNSDGSVDAGFNVGGKYIGNVWFVDAQGRTYFSNFVTSANEIEPLTLGRLLPSGALDPGFNAPALSATISAVLQQPDGRLLLSLDESYSAPQQIARLNSDGSLDAGFSYTPPADLTTSVRLATLPDGRFVIGGKRSLGADNAYVWRFLSSGAPDPTFEPFPIYTGGKGSITTVVAQPDGKLLLGGRFDEVGIPPRRGVVRLLADTSQPSGPAPCTVKRYTGDGSGSWGAYTRTFYEAGTTFTLQARSTSAARGMVFINSDATTYLGSIGSVYTAPRLTQYSAGFSSSTANTSANWVDIKICAPATVTPTPTPSPTPPPAACTTRRYYGDGTGSWGSYSKATYPAGSSFTLTARSTSAARGMVFVTSDAVSYLGSTGSSYSAPSQAAYNVGFNSSTANTKSNWVEIKICTPATAQAASPIDEVLLTDELPEPAAEVHRIFLPLLQNR